MTVSGLLIRRETRDDYEAISGVHALAFGRENESRLVERLRGTAPFISELSLVAQLDGRVVGHVLFFPVAVADGKVRRETLALAPLAVLPDRQRKGIGGRLVKAGLDAAGLGWRAALVLGGPGYYSPFGFEPARRWRIEAPFPVPENAFMAMELIAGGLAACSGTVEYPDAFNDV